MSDTAVFYGMTGDADNIFPLTDVAWTLVTYFIL